MTTPTQKIALITGGSRGLGRNNPKTAMPGTLMTYAGLKNDNQRASLIAYLATLTSAAGQ